MGPRDIESTTHDDGDTGTRRMFDKRTLRRMYRAHFDVAIQTYRSGEQHRAVQVLPPSGTAVYLRKRPLFEKEAEDFDVITALPQGVWTPLDDKGMIRGSLLRPFFLWSVNTP